MAWTGLTFPLCLQTDFDFLRKANRALEMRLLLKKATSIFSWQHVFLASCIFLWQTAYLYYGNMHFSMANMHVLHSSFWGDPHVCKKRGPVFLNSSELLGETPIPVPNQKFKFRLVDNVGTLWESIGLCSLLNWKFIHILKSWLKII